MYDRFRRTLVGLKRRYVDFPQPEGPSFRRTLVGLKREHYHEGHTVIVFQTNPRGVEAGVCHVLRVAHHRFRRTLVGLKLGRSGGQSLGLKMFQTNPRGVEASRSRCARSPMR